MSRILVFDKENKQAGEVHAVVTRGWAISDGGSSQFVLANDEALKPWVQLGRMIWIDGDDKVPNWAGVIDTPWSMVSPVTVTAYDVPYLLSRRCPYKIDVQEGDTRKLALRFLELNTQLGDDWIREGEIASGDASRRLEITTGTLWDQLKAMVTNAGMELSFRSEKTADKRLVHYLDIKRMFGVISQVVLQDGEGGNMQVQGAALDGEFYNSVIGFNNSSTSSSRMYTEVMRDQDSIDLFGLRNKAVQFATNSQSELDQYVKNYLTANGRPKVKITVGVRDVEGLFAQIRLGNMLTVRATNLVLPGGRSGWSGQARVGAMTYNEATNQLALTLEGEL